MTLAADPGNLSGNNRFNRRRALSYGRGSERTSEPGNRASHQNMNFSANCIDRGVFAMLVITPAEP